MEEEYHTFNSNGQKRLSKLKTFQLQDGTILSDLCISYTTYGSLDTAQSKVVLVCHALTGNSDARSWWPSLFQSSTYPSGVLTKSHFVICINMLGTPYNLTNPCSMKWTDFSTSFYTRITVQDQARLQLQIIEQEFNIRNIFLIIGGSLGGMICQTILKLSLLTRVTVENIVLACCGHYMHAWQKAFTQVQRNCILHAQDKVKGLKIARQIALLSYRTHISYDEKFCRGKDNNIKEYFEYCSTSFVNRYNVFSYLTLLNTMDSFEPKIEGIENFFKFKGRALIVSVDSDILYPPIEQTQLVKQFLKSAVRHTVISSKHGHDGFLLEQHALNDAILKFLACE